MMQTCTRSCHLINKALTPTLYYGLVCFQWPVLLVCCRYPMVNIMQSSSHPIFWLHYVSIAIYLHVCTRVYCDVPFGVSSLGLPCAQHCYMPLPTHAQQTLLFCFCAACPFWGACMFSSGTVCPCVAHQCNVDRLYQSLLEGSTIGAAPTRVEQLELSMQLSQNPQNKLAKINPDKAMDPEFKGVYNMCAQTLSTNKPCLQVHFIYVVCTIAA